MARLLYRNIFLAFLRNLRFARDYTKFSVGRLALLLAFLASASGRKLSKWWHSRPGKPDTSQTPKPVDPPLFDTKANPYSVSGGPAIVKRYVVAASHVPASASLPSLHERVERQSLPMVDSDLGVGTPPALANLPVEYPHGHSPQHSLDESDSVNRSSGNLSIASIQSRASDRLSIITTSRDSIRATHGQPSRLPRATYRQFGRGPDLSRSRERPTRPNTPLSRPHTPHDPSRLEIITTNLPSPALENDTLSPVVPPSSSSAYSHGPLSPPPMNEIPWRRSSSSFVANVDVWNPSTESLPINPHDELVPGSPTSSDAEILDLPEGRFVQLINSDQIPRYTRDAVM